MLIYKDLNRQNMKVLKLSDVREASNNKTRREELSDTLYNDISAEIQKNHPDIISDIIKGKKGKDVLIKVIEEVIEKSDYTKGFAKGDLVKEQVDQIIGWGKLQPLINEGNITNIFTNMNLEVVKRVGGKDVKTNIKFESDDELERYIRNIMIRTGEQINRDKCIADAYDKLYNIRIVAGIYGSPTRREVVKRPFLALRLYPAMNFTEKDFVKNGTFDEDILRFAREYLNDAVVAIAGQPDAGKSTILDFLNTLDDDMTRTIVIEEEAELKYQNGNSVFFEERKGGREDLRYRYDMSEFTRVATRLAGKKVSIGEVRGLEAWFLKRLIDMGYKASYTIHGSSCRSALEQTAWLMTLYNPQMSVENCVRELTKSINFIIYVEQRKIVDIAEVIGYDEVKKEPILNYIFKLEVSGDGTLYWKRGSVSEEYKKKATIKRKLKERNV